MCIGGRMIKNTLTTGEVAGFCDVNFRTVMRWIDKGLLKGYRLPGTRGDHRVVVSDLMQFMANQNMPIPLDLIALQNQKNDIDEAAVEPVGAGPSQTPRVLIIEDEIPVANAIRRALRNNNVDIEMVHDGFSAGVRLSEFDPHLVTLDMQMPGVHGLVVLNLMKQDFPHIKVIVISAADDITLEKTRQLGADGVLEKPYENSELSALVKQLIN
jgi:two-component system, OmpR family, response regulator VicR